MKSKSPDTDVVNASGFLFQLAIAHQIQSSHDEHGWEVISQEHPWRHDKSGSEGYIDLLLTSGTMRMVAECKRRRDATWFFIVPPGPTTKISRARFAWSGFHPEKDPRTGWQDFGLSPGSAESAFCLTRGTGEDDGNVLERMCDHLLDSLECVALEELELFRRDTHDRWSVYVPVIITNAELKLCKVDPSKVSLSQGTIDGPEFETVPIVRFRKSLSTSLTSGAKPKTFQESNRDKERTVLIVNAVGLSKTLRRWNIETLDPFERLPREINW
jgi:hypothetical protein